jgi:hypothetical protein
MFEWLDDEIARIQTRRFHRVDGPASASARRTVRETGRLLPPSYVEFVRRYGRASLYRMPRLDLYWIRVLAPPLEAQSTSGDALIEVGGFDEQWVYFKEDLVTDHWGAESPVFEGSRGRLRKAAETFGEWLERRARTARKRYTKKEWAAILKGPPPFSLEEWAVVEARRQFRWRVVGVSEAGELRFEVTNGSDRRLPYLSVGIRSRVGGLEGGVWLPVGHIGQGETAVVEKETYKDLVAPEDVEAYALPDPEPEERDRYWEFR